MEIIKKLLPLAILVLIKIAVYAQDAKPRLVLPIAHGGLVTSVKFSTDGKKVVTASKDNTAKIWDVESGKLLADLTGHSGEIYTAQFSPDGKKIVTASKDNIVKIWSAESGELLIDIKSNINKLVSASFSPDGKKVLVRAEKTSIWDIESRNLLTEMPENTYIQFSHDGKIVVTASNNGTTKLWDAHRWTELAVLNTKFVWFAAFSSNDKKIVTSFGNTAKIWDTQSGILLADLTGHTDVVNHVQFSPDGKKIVTASHDKTVKIWETQRGILLADIKGNDESVISAKFSPRR